MIEKLSQHQINMLINKIQIVIEDVVELRRVHLEQGKLSYFYVNIPPYELCQLAHALAVKGLEKLEIRSLLLENRLLVMV